MCARNEVPDVYAVMVELWINLDHDDAALMEGWFLTPSDDPEQQEPLRVQRAADAAGLEAAWGLPFAVPVLASDSEAWALVRDGTQPHHRAAHELLALFNPPELGRIALGAPSLASLTSLEQP
jgi:hypothetical protein